MAARRETDRQMAHWVVGTGQSPETYWSCTVRQRNEIAKATNAANRRR